MTPDPDRKPAGVAKRTGRKRGAARQAATSPSPPPPATASPAPAGEREEEWREPACAPGQPGMDAIRLLQLFAIAIAALALAWLVLSSILHLF